MGQTDELETCRRREERFLTKLNNNIAWYKLNAEKNRVWHHALSVIVIFLGVLAPLTVVGASGAIGAASAGTQNLTLLGVSTQTLAIISLFITLVLGIVEGLRRHFKFEQRWHSFYTSWLTLIHLREAYRDAQARVALCSKEWWDNYERARKAMESWVENETKAYFDAALSGPKGSPRPE
jgi:hypothetical protein